MMAQDISEASSSRPMTTCTTGLAFEHQLDDREFIVHREPSTFGLDEIGQGARPERFGVDADHAHFAVGEQRSSRHA